MDISGRRINFHSIADLIKPNEHEDEARTGNRIKQMKGNAVKTEDSIQPTDSRKERTIYNAHQVYVLEQVFTKTHYPDADMVEKLSQQLDIVDSKIKVWFQNKRARWRRKPSSETRNDYSNEESIIYGSYFYPNITAESIGSSPRVMGYSGCSTNIGPQGGVYTDNRIIRDRAVYYPEAHCAAKFNFLTGAAYDCYLDSYRNRFQNMNMYHANTHGQPTICPSHMYYHQMNLNTCKW